MDSSIPHMDKEIPKMVLRASDKIDHLDSHVIRTEDMENGYSPSKMTKASREILYDGTTSENKKYFAAEELKFMLRKCKIIRYKDHHFTLADRQPSESIISELIKLITSRIYKTLRELSNKIYA